MQQSWICQQHRVCCLPARQKTLLRQHQRSWHPHSRPEWQARRRCESWISSTSCWRLAGSPEQTFPAPGRSAAAHASSAFTPNNVFSLVTIAIMPLYTLMVGFPRCQLVSTQRISDLASSHWLGGSIFCHSSLRQSTCRRSSFSFPEPSSWQAAPSTLPSWQLGPPGAS